MADRAERLQARLSAPKEKPIDVLEALDAAEIVQRHQRKDGVKWDEANARFTCWLPLDVARRVRLAAKERGESVSALVTRAIRQELDHQDTPYTVDGIR
jgi:hypothetical protein